MLYCPLATAANDTNANAKHNINQYRSLILSGYLFDFVSCLSLLSLHPNLNNAFIIEFFKFSLFPSFFILLFFKWIFLSGWWWSCCLFAFLSYKLMQIIEMIISIISLPHSGSEAANLVDTSWSEHAREHAFDKDAKKKGTVNPRCPGYFCSWIRDSMWYLVFRTYISIRTYDVTLYLRI